MPLLSKVGTFSFNKESCFDASSFIFVKNCLLFINFLSMIAGLILIAVGGYITTNPELDVFGLGSSIAVASIVIGIFVSIVSFLGCFGAANEKGMLLKTYFAILVILIIMELSMGIAGYVKMDDLDRTATSTWIDIYNNGNRTQLLTVEKYFRCCGLDNNTSYAVPENCTATLGFTNSCKTAALSNLDKNLETIGAAGISIAVIEIVGLIFAVIMFRKISSKESAQSALLNEAWRINRTKVQYGYQNYQYV